MTKGERGDSNPRPPGPQTPALRVAKPLICRAFVEWAARSARRDIPADSGRFPGVEALLGSECLNAWRTHGATRIRVDPALRRSPNLSAERQSTLPHLLVSRRGDLSRAGTPPSRSRRSSPSVDAAARPPVGRPRRQAARRSGTPRQRGTTRLRVDQLSLMSRDVERYDPLRFEPTSIGVPLRARRRRAGRPTAMRPSRRVSIHRHRRHRPVAPDPGRRYLAELPRQGNLGTGDAAGGPRSRETPHAAVVPTR